MSVDAAGRSDPGQVRLFRAVSPGEIRDIQEYGFRQHPGGLSYEGKLFAVSFEDADAWGRELYLTEGETYAIVEVTLTARVAQQLERVYADRREAVFVGAEQLVLLSEFAVRRAR